MIHSQFPTKPYVSHQMLSPSSFQLSTKLSSFLLNHPSQVGTLYIFIESHTWWLSERLVSLSDVTPGGGSRCKGVISFDYLPGSILPFGLPHLKLGSNFHGNFHYVTLQPVEFVNAHKWALKVGGYPILNNYCMTWLVSMRPVALSYFSTTTASGQHHITMVGALQVPAVCQY